MWKKIVFGTILVVLFLALTLGILIVASGYRVNWINLTVSETSLVWLKGNDKKVDVYLDGKKISKKLPVRINYVNEGWREIKIQKPGYYDWKKSFYAENGKAYELRNIILFKKDLNPKIITSQAEIDKLKHVVVPLNISVDRGELKANDTLVTRFFEDPLAYQWYSDGQHIIFQIDKSIRVIDLDGTNDNVLVDLSSDVPSKFEVIKSGKVLLYSDGNVVKEAQIR